jgi:hypothetical protein
MGHFLLYQILPLAALWLAFDKLVRAPYFDRWGHAAIFLAGAALQAALWLASRPTLENADSLGFFRLAHGMETDLRALLYRPKLYPWFLASFPSAPSLISLKAATFCQCLLKLAMGGCLLRFARLCAWKPSTTAFLLFLFLFGSLWLSAPLSIFDTTLFAFLFAVFLVLAAEVRARYSAPGFAAMCIAAGLTSLTRQVADLALLAVLTLTTIAVLRQGPGAGIGRRRLFLAVGLALLAGLAVGGAGAAVNGIRHGVWARSVALGVNAYTHAAYYQLRDPRSPEWGFVEAALPGARGELPAWETGFAHAIPWEAIALPHRLERALGSADAGEILAGDRLLRGRALRWALGKPASYLASFANELSRLLGKCEELYPDSLIDPHARGPLFLRRAESGAIYQPPWLLLAAGLAALILGRRNRPLLLIPALAALAYLAPIAALQMGFTRYALPALLPLLLIAGEAVDRIPSPFPSDPA